MCGLILPKIIGPPGHARRLRHATWPAQCQTPPPPPAAPACQPSPGTILNSHPVHADVLGLLPQARMRGSHTRGNAAERRSSCECDRLPRGSAQSTAPPRLCALCCRVGMKITAEK
ncbi:hypothetical protein K456DRAFT_1604823 [Colletotrichum gloeosporioides 23]|nr:hypothetical protein K456DRAFT_1604823 [Colletotrichum gloeosporioides 23]